jgi:hypothetical protein
MGSADGSGVAPGSGPAEPRTDRDPASDGSFIAGWFIAAGVVRLLGVLGLATIALEGQGGGFGALGLALLSLVMLDGAPLLAVVGVAIAVLRDRRWPVRLRSSWRIALMAVAASVDVGWLASGAQVPAELRVPGLLPLLLDGVVAVLVVPGKVRRWAGWYLAMCVIAVGLLWTLAVATGGPRVRVVYAPYTVVTSDHEPMRFGWTGSADGQFVVRLGGSDCRSGALIDAGAYDPGAGEPAPAFFTLATSALGEERNTIRICLTNATGTGQATLVVTLDDSPPASPAASLAGA